MSDPKLGEPVPTGVPGIEPGSSTEVQDAADAVARPFERTIDSMTATYPNAAPLDQLLLFPMTLGVSMALASTAMLFSPALMAKRLGTAGITR